MTREAEMAGWHLTRSTDAHWLKWEQDLQETGVSMPLQYRIAYTSATGEESWCLTGVDGARFRSGCCIQVRHLPLKHRILRVDRLGSTVEEGAEGAIAHALAALVASDSGTLRLDLRVFDCDSARRALFDDALRAAGFETTSGGYTRTIVLDLDRSEEEVFASFSSSARRNIRSLAKTPARLEPIRDERWIPHMERLLAETMHRTGGAAAQCNWAGRIRLAAENPELARLVGITAVEDGEERLLGFAWGCMHGDHGEYNDAASTRRTGARVQVGHPLVWDLVKWARASGARWFDLGGVTAGSAGDRDDPLGGISDFKRSFGGTVTDVASEWMLPSSTLRASVALRLARLRRGS